MNTGKSILCKLTCRLALGLLFIAFFLISARYWITLWTLWHLSLPAF